MTDASIPFNSSVYDSFCELRSSIDALSCAAHLVPFGGDDEGLGCMFRVLSERIEGDLTAHFSALASSNAKSGDPLGSDLVIDDTQYK
ncbi:hypothetical protein BXO00_24405 [Salmonella enterica subsp. enterica serovar Mikawasima]|nr:hypothetical protein [Salmonella enterica subsp. enterica serovar Mikawasima]